MQQGRHRRATSHLLALTTSDGFDAPSRMSNGSDSEEDVMVRIGASRNRERTSGTGPASPEAEQCTREPDTAAAHLLRWHDTFFVLAALLAGHCLAGIVLCTVELLLANIMNPWHGYALFFGSGIVLCVCTIAVWNVHRSAIDEGHDIGEGSHHHVRVVVFPVSVLAINVVAFTCVALWSIAHENEYISFPPDSSTTPTTLDLRVRDGVSMSDVEAQVRDMLDQYTNWLMKYSRAAPRWIAIMSFYMAAWVVAAVSFVHSTNAHLRIQQLVHAVFRPRVHNGDRPTRTS